MRIMIIGGGGREHALLWKLAQSPKVEKIYCVPGNPGMQDLAICLEGNPGDNAAMVRLAQEHAIDLVVVGPEAPLANGIVDAFNKAKIAVFGPNQAAARLESSKDFAKTIMIKYGIPTAAYASFQDAEAAKSYIRKQGAPIVVKADGLAAGKGVVVAATTEVACQAVDEMLTGHSFGLAGERVVIEECLVGEEVSLLAFVDGETVVPMVAAQDHKRIFDDDQGPNTGGMGAYAPAPVLTPELAEQVKQEVLLPVVRAMAQEGCPYKGCLYAGLILTEEGPKVIEFNARFGDPETQVVLPLLDGDLAEILLACSQGKLSEVDVAWKDGAAVCVVMASWGYPGPYESGMIISGIEGAKQKEGIVFHSGTRQQDGQLMTDGGRVLGVTAVAQDIQAAIRKAYQAVIEVSFAGMHFRRDIGRKALNRLQQ
ncbi:phosphoribosylamine--glycine ligase [Azotosporobacter soli]|uniref:phosphoribosylamine--glycine ligase n=1 Tax=Azotosporobacter soli TaxID=3055040 RepID=UPI0031FED6D1